VVPVVADNPDAGDQLYVEAPLAVKLALEPKQIESAAGDTVIVGIEFTVIVTVACADVPQVLLAVTEIFPPDVFAIILMELVVDVPVQPLGNVHV
jgi:hypothetical protein